jgi:hypothetical protein
MAVQMANAIRLFLNKGDNVFMGWKLDSEKVLLTCHTVGLSEMLRVVCTKK